MKRVMAILLLGFSTLTASAQVFGDIYLSVKKDPITDENRSVLLIREINDREALTMFRVQCNVDRYEVYLITKHELYTAIDGFVDETPSIIYRFDAKTPVSIENTGSVIGDGPDDVLTNVLTIKSDLIVNKMLKDGLSSKKMIIRVNRLKGSSLDYTFNISNLKTALPKMGCPVKL